MMRGIRNFLSDTLEKIIIYLSKKHELKKYKDPRRVSIYSKIQLTKEQKKQIDDLYLTNYGKKIPYIWHRHFTAFTGNFDAKYFPESMFIPEFERYMSFKKEYAQVFTDKNMLPMLGKEAKVKTLKSFLYRKSVKFPEVSSFLRKN